MPFGSFLRILGMCGHSMSNAERFDSPPSHPFNDFEPKESSFRPGAALRKRSIRNRPLGHPALDSAFADLEEFGDVPFRENVTAAHWKSLLAWAFASPEFPFMCDEAIP